jgi:hypothetical protein
MRREYRIILKMTWNELFYEATKKMKAFFIPF